MSRRKHSGARGRAKRLADEDQTRAAPHDGRPSISHQAPLLERMANDPKVPSLAAHQLRGLQATHGNQHVQRLLTEVQRKGKTRPRRGASPATGAEFRLPPREAKVPPPIPSREVPDLWAHTVNIVRDAIRQHRYQAAINAIVEDRAQKGDDFSTVIGGRPVFRRRESRVPANYEEVGGRTRIRIFRSAFEDGPQYLYTCIVHELAHARQPRVKYFNLRWAGLEIRALLAEVDALEGAGLGRNKTQIEDLKFWLSHFWEHSGKCTACGRWHKLSKKDAQQLRARYDAAIRKLDTALEKATPQPGVEWVPGQGVVERPTTPEARPSLLRRSVGVEAEGDERDLREAANRGFALGPVVAKRVLALQAAHGNQYVARGVETALRSRAAHAFSPSRTAPLIRQTAKQGRSADARQAAPGAIQLSPAPAAKAVLVTGAVDKRTFSLEGKTLDAVATELDTRDEWGRGGAENIAYEYTASAKGAVTSIKITAVLFTELPAWPALAQQPAPVKKEWKRMMGALRKHENRHVQIARKYLTKMKTSMKGKAEAKLGETYDDWLAKLQEAQKKYDTDTNNGQTKGVNLDLGVVPAPP